MPQQKDLKRKVRSRMTKTGESYTAARAQLLAKKTVSASSVEPPPPPASKAREATIDYAALAGMRDESVKAKTGRDWKGWLEALDAAGVAEWPHREIARHLHTAFGVSPWWAQTVTVGYERIRGRREIGQRVTGSYEINKSRTFPVPLESLYRAWSDGRVRRRWLPEAGLTVRKATEGRSMRITWPDATSVELWFVSKGEGKSYVQVQHSKLADREDGARRKAYWGERLDALAAFLAASTD